MKSVNYKPCTKVQKVPYVRHGGSLIRVDRRYQSFGHSMQTLGSMTGRSLIRFLRADRMLPRWAEKPCPRCAQVTLSSLYYRQTKQTWTHRCSAKRCGARIQLHAFHPVFYHGSGSSFTSLGMQAAILHCALANDPTTSVPQLLDVDHKLVDRI